MLITFSLVEAAMILEEAQVMAISDDSLVPDAGISLDPSGINYLESIQVIRPGEDLVITAFDHRRLASVYELTTGVSSRTDYLVNNGRLSFEAPVIGSLLCVSHSRLELFRTLSTDSIIRLYPFNNNKLYEYRRYEIDSVDELSGSQTQLLFSVSESGPWATNLAGASMPTVIYTKIPANTIVNVTTSIRLTLDSFL